MGEGDVKIAGGAVAEILLMCAADKVLTVERSLNFSYVYFPVDEWDFPKARIELCQLFM